jgi:ribulose-5-phosphate 4-epimerase/fuculose-1-phosphate aldolase
MMEDVSDYVLAEFLQACHDAGARGLMRCSSGNISRRLDDARMLATSSRSWAENMSAEDICVCRIADGAILDGLKPTAEIGFHAGILRTRHDIDVVMHFQTPCATDLACRETDNIDYFVIPEIPFYIGHVARVPYLLPGSKELADAVTEAMQDHDMVVIRNHGMVTVATDFAHAIQNAEFFELACEVITRGGNTPKSISQLEASSLGTKKAGMAVSRWHHPRKRWSTSCISVRQSRDCLRLCRN